MKQHIMLFLAALLALCELSMGLTWSRTTPVCRISKRGDLLSKRWVPVSRISWPGAYSMFGKKIDDEIDSVPQKKTKRREKGKGKRKGKAQKGKKAAAAADKSDFDESKQIDFDSAATSSDRMTADSTSVGDGADMVQAPFKNRGEENIKVEKVPRGNPLEQMEVPPEVVFFGEPRNPPPVQAINDLNFHGPLLGWARHGNIMPRTSEERLEYVFPRGRLHPDATTFRFQDPDSLTYDEIFSRFLEIMDDLEKSKAFIDANIDIVPSKMFLKVISGEKLEAQSKDKLEEMNRLKEVREKYLVAHDQVFFPFNMEIKKAETRVMTYLGRAEIQGYAQSWDSVELSMHFLVLLCARLKWDRRAATVLGEVRKQVDETMSFMRDGVQRELLNTRYRSPGLTAELYRNTSLSIQENMPELYARVRPEVQILHETYLMDDKAAVKRYIEEVFCQRSSISPEQLTERLKMLESSVMAIQGREYAPLQKRVGFIFEASCSAKELDLADKWYAKRLKQGYDFKTYAPDEGTLPKQLEIQQRMRDKGNAFSNFYVDTLKGKTIYTDAFASNRPRASDVGDWLTRDRENTPLPKSYEERIEAFRESYCKQMELRQAAESRLPQLVANRMSEHDTIYVKRLYKISDPFSDADQLDDMRQAQALAEKQRGMESNVVEYDGIDE